MKKNKKVKYLLIIMILICISIDAYYYYMSKSINKYEITSPTTATIKRAKNDITFEVIPDEGVMDTFFYIMDKQDNLIDNSITVNDNIITIKPPDNLYEKHKTYTLKLLCSTFKNTDLKEVREVTFTIE